MWTKREEKKACRSVPPQWFTVVTQHATERARERDEREREKKKERERRETGESPRERERGMNERDE